MLIKTLLIAIICISQSINIHLQKINRNSYQSIQLQYSRYRQPQISYYFEIDLSDISHQNFQNGSLFIRIQQDNHQYSDHCYIHYNIAIISTEDPTNFISQFNQTIGQNIVDPYTVYDIQIDIVQYRIDIYPYIIGKIEAINGSSDNCISRFQMSTKVDVEPLIVSANSVTSIAVYYDKQYKASKNVKIDFSSISTNQPNQVCNIRMECMGNQRTRYNIQLKTTRFYKNGTSFVVRQMMVSNSTVINVGNLSGEQIVGLQQIMIELEASQTDLKFNVDQEFQLVVKTLVQSRSQQLSISAVVLIVVAVVLLLVVVVVVVNRYVKNRKSDRLLLQQAETSLQNRL